MNKKIGKIVTVSALALAITSAATAGPMAAGLSTKYSEQSIENFVESTGNAYEDLTEAYPDNAQNNPSAPFEYVKSCVKLGNNFLSFFK